MVFSFILLGAGISNRFKSNTPKQYHKIAGKTLVDISLKKIKQFKEIKTIIYVYNKKHKKHFKDTDLKGVKLIEGGKTRHESTYNALNYLSKKKKVDKVLIHDAARPNFSQKLIKSILVNSKKHKSVIPFLKIQDALKKKKKQKFVNLDRNKFFLTQTPQCFNLNQIFQLHKKLKKEYVDDDFSLLESFNNIKFVRGEKRNFKVTDREDFNLLENFYNSKISIGIGFDVHRLVPGEKLFLGGVKIPSKLGTLGHSDGDPVLHSVIDAILGACNMGDIGEKFSDKNKKYKNIRSSELIKNVISKVKKQNYAISNIDINIITETPKLKKFKKKISKNIADLCDISSNWINIKAKTTEKLGVIGQEKAIASEVVVSVVKYD